MLFNSINLFAGDK